MGLATNKGVRCYEVSAVDKASGRFSTGGLSTVSHLLQFDFPSLVGASARMASVRMIRGQCARFDRLARHFRFRSALDSVIDLKVRMGYAGWTVERERSALVGDLGEALGYLAMTGLYDCTEVAHFSTWLQIVENRILQRMPLPAPLVAAARTFTKKRSPRPDFVFSRGGSLVVAEFKGSLRSYATRVRWQDYMKSALKQVEAGKDIIRAVQGPHVSNAYVIVSVLCERGIRGEESRIFVCDPEEQDGAAGDLAEVLFDMFRRVSYGNWLEFIGFEGLADALTFQSLQTDKLFPVLTVRMQEQDFSFLDTSEHSSDSECVTPAPECCLHGRKPTAQCPPCCLRFGIERHRLVKLLEFARNPASQREWASIPAFERVRTVRLSNKVGPEMEIRALQKDQGKEESTLAVFPDGSVCVYACMLEHGTREEL